jgi:peptidoglycan/LPS O-acetylase OafA/YrhL
MKPTEGQAAYSLLGRQFPVLDWFRALAALAVFAQHAYQQYSTLVDSTALKALLSHLGAWGVAIFFVLSGFCIHWSRLSQTRGGRPFDKVEYASRRFFRIYPALLACLLLSYWLGNAYGSNLLPPSSLGEVIQHLLLVSGLSSTHRTAVNNVLWSVVVEMHFYILYGLLPGAFSSTRRVVLTTLAAVLIGAATFVGSVTLYPAGPSRVMVQHLALASWWTWCLGALVAEVVAKRQELALFLRPRRHMLLLSALTLMSVGMCWAPAYLVLPLQRFVLPVLAAGMLACALQSSLAFERVKSLMLLGSMSYSLYLLHPVAILIGLQMHLPALGTSMVTLASGLLMACLSFRVIETPGIRLGRQFMSPSRPVASNVAAS